MEYILVFCTLAIGHSLFSTVALLILSKKLSNRLLAVLLFLLSLRIGKSVVGMFFLPGMNYELSAIGVSAMAAIGPVLFLLIRSLFTNAFAFSAKTYLHLLPALLLPATLPLSNWKILSPAYYAITGHVLAYIIICFLYIFRNRELFKTDDLKWRWGLSLVGGVSILWCTFALQITVYQPVVYATNVVVAALVFYGLSLWAIKRSRLFLPEPSGKTENTQALEELGKRIQVLLEADQVFTDSNLTVSLLAGKLKVQPYLLSRAVNYFFKKSFSELLIYYRIKKAEQLLLSPNSKMYTIEGIAFESGFNTLSAFYSAFKKIHKTTPALYRESKGKTANLKIA
jgi:AraC-like DNA-binding protein